MNERNDSESWVSRMASRGLFGDIGRIFSHISDIFNIVNNYTADKTDVENVEVEISADDEKEGA